MGTTQFEQVVQASVNETLRWVALDWNNIVAANGGMSHYEILATPGYIARVLQLYLRFDKPLPTVATTGSHYLAVTMGTQPQVNLQNVPIMVSMLGTGTFSTDIIFDGNKWGTGVTPSPDNAAAPVVVQGLQFDEVTPLVITYRNQTDKASSTGNKTLRMLVAERKVGS